MVAWLDHQRVEGMGEAGSVCGGRTRKVGGGEMERVGRIFSEPFNYTMQ